MLKPVSSFRTYIVAVGIVIALSGNANAIERDLTYDASSMEAFRKSVAAIYASLPPERAEKLKWAGMAVAFGHALKDTQGSGLERLTQMGLAMKKDPEKILELLMTTLNGKTADQVIQMAALQKLENLETRRRELDSTIETMKYLIVNYDEISQRERASGRVDTESLRDEKHRLVEKMRERDRLDEAIRETEQDAIPDQ